MRNGLVLLTLELMALEHRADPREAVSLPVQLGGGGGVAVTRDISASGLFLEIDAHQQVGGQVELEVLLETPGGPIRLKAMGQVVRIDQRGDRVGVAVRLIDSQLTGAE